MGRGRPCQPGVDRQAASRRHSSRGTWLRRALIEAGKAAGRTKATYLGAQDRQIARRRGPNKAAVAVSVSVAHSILVAAWHMLSIGQTYEDMGAGYFAARHTPEAESRRLVKRLQALGHDVTVTSAA